MELVYRTLQRPEVDALAWTPADDIRAKGEGRVLSFVQTKTGRPIDIGIAGQLEALVRAAIGSDDGRLGRPADGGVHCNGSRRGLRFWKRHGGRHLVRWPCPGSSRMKLPVGAFVV